MNISDLSREVSEAYSLGSYTGYGASVDNLEAYLIKLKTIKAMAELLQLSAEYELKKAQKTEAEKKEQLIHNAESRIIQTIEDQLK